MAQVSASEFSRKLWVPHISILRCGFAECPAPSTLSAQYPSVEQTYRQRDILRLTHQQMHMLRHHHIRVDRETIFLSHRLNCRFKDLSRSRLCPIRLPPIARKRDKVRMTQPEASLQPASHGDQATILQTHISKPRYGAPGIREETEVGHPPSAQADPEICEHSR